MKSKLFKLISVILVIAILSVSFICDAFAVTESREPQSYMIGFDSSLWQITDASDNVSITAGGAIQTNNYNLFNVTYTGNSIDLSDGFVFQIETTITGSYNRYWGDKHKFNIGGLTFTIEQAYGTGTKRPVKYTLTNGDTTIADFTSDAYATNNSAPSQFILNYTNALFTMKYKDGKLTLYNEKLINADTNPDGVVTWTLADSTVTTEVPVSQSLFADAGFSINKGWGGTIGTYIVFDSLYLCDYDYFKGTTSSTIQQKQVNIACIGDSITFGVGTYSGYRYYLFEKLFNAGAHFGFVGPYTTSSDSRLPSTYCQHGGYSGAVIGPNNNSGSRSSYDYLDQYVTGEYGTADIALVMLGHNNYYQNIDRDNIDEVYKNFVRRIFELAPDITVYCGSMVNEVSGIAPDEADGYVENGLNALLPGIVTDLQAEGYDVQFVDLKNITNLSGANGDFGASDGVHPNENGQKKIASAWYDAIVSQVLEMNEAGEGSGLANIKPVKGVKSEVDEMDLTVGGYAQRMTSFIQPSSATFSTIKYSSSDDEIATVDEFGLVSPVSQGECTITATSLEGGYTDTCDVTVNAAPDGQNQLSEIFRDDFQLANRWTGQNSWISDDKGQHIYFPGGSNTWNVDTVRLFNTDSEFKVTMNYYCSGNEASVNGHYVSYSYAGFEVRVYNAGKTVTLLFDGEELGSWTSTYEINAHSYILYYNGGTVQIIRDNEIIIRSSVDYSRLPATSYLHMYAGEFNRFAQIYWIKVESLTAEDIALESSVIDTTDYSGYNTVIGGFDSNTWSVSTESSDTVSITNGSVYSSNRNDLTAEYTGSKVDISDGFKLSFTLNTTSVNSGSDSRYWGGSNYYSVGGVTLEIRQAYDSNQVKWYPVSLYVYTDSQFDSETGVFESGNLAGVIVTDANGIWNEVSEDVLKYTNAEYTIFYDGKNLYVKNSVLGTLFWETKDGHSAAISVDSSNFYNSGVKLYKSWGGYSNGAAYFQDISLSVPYTVCRHEFSDMSASGDVQKFNAVCGICGAVRSFDIGDANCDYEINSSDLLAVQQHLLGIKEINYYSACDFNLDGKIDAADITLIQMHILAF